MNILWIVLGVAALVGMYFWSLYNGLVSLKTQIEEAWSQIDIQLKRRADLIPNLVTTVKGYAKHEKTVFTDVTKARTALMGAKSLHDKAEASDMLTGALGKLFAVAESYPELKANENFLQLQKELSETENKIEMARRFYNGAVRELNTAVESFPSNAVAGAFGIGKRAFFEITNAGDRDVPNVSTAP